MRQSRKYLILIIIYIFTILGTFYFSRVYSNSSSYYESDVGILDITGSYDAMYYNILNYASENDYFVVYISSEDYSGDYLFINADKVSYSDLNRLFESFGVSIGKLPVYVTFKNGRVINVSSEVVE